MNYFERLLSLSSEIRPASTLEEPLSHQWKEQENLSQDAGLPLRDPSDFSLMPQEQKMTISVQEAPQPSPWTWEIPRDNSKRELAEEISEEVMFDALRGERMG